MEDGTDGGRGVGEWKAYAERRPNTDLIVCSQKVSKKEWEVTSLSSLSESSSMSTATDYGSTSFEEEGSCLGDLVSDEIPSRIIKNSSSIRKNIICSKNMIYWESPK